jgi:hypothetical protein
MTEVEALFARPLLAADRRTLGDVVYEAFNLVAHTLIEQDDPDIKEVLPGLPASALPAASRMRRRLPALADALGRIGRPVCVAVPHWCQGQADDQLGDGAFLVASMAADGHPGITQVPEGELARWGDPVNGHHFNPDGTALTV